MPQPCRPLRRFEDARPPQRPGQRPTPRGANTEVAASSRSHHIDTFGRPESRGINLASPGSEATTTLFTAVETGLSRSWMCRATLASMMRSAADLYGAMAACATSSTNAHRHAIEAALKVLDGLLHQGAHPADVLAAAREDATRRRDRPRSCFAKDQCAWLDILHHPTNEKFGWLSRDRRSLQHQGHAGRMEACFNVPWRYRDAVASPNGEFARDRLGRGNVYCGVEGPLRVEGRQVCRFSAA